MAAPPEKTIKDLNGKWQMNKTLSNSSEPVLALQGIGFLTRKGVGLATITLNINQYSAPPKPPSTATDVVVHIDIAQSASGLSGTQENRCLDWVFRPHSDWLFGSVESRTRWVALDEIEDEFLKGNWLIEGEPGEKSFISSFVESKEKGWIAEQVWGFQTVDGKRMYCRNLVLTKGKERVEVRFVYDYLS